MELSIEQLRELIIGGGSSDPQTMDCEPEEIRIVVLQRGWVVVGYYSREGLEVTVRNAHCIRKWGTTRGLGELRYGPLENTVLDPSGVVKCHRLSVVHTFDCDQVAWRDKCK